MQVELNWRQQAAALIECGSAHAYLMCHGFVAFLWKIPPIWPVLSVVPFHNCFAVNNLRQDRHLHAVEVVGSNPVAPANPFNNLGDLAKSHTSRIRYRPLQASSRMVIHGQTEHDAGKQAT